MRHYQSKISWFEEDLCCSFSNEGLEHVLIVSLNINDVTKLWKSFSCIYFFICWICILCWTVCQQEKLNTLQFGQQWGCKYIHRNHPERDGQKKWIIEEDSDKIQQHKKSFEMSLWKNYNSSLSNGQCPFQQNLIKISTNSLSFSEEILIHIYLNWVL